MTGRPFKLRKMHWFVLVSLCVLANVDGRRHSHKHKRHSEHHHRANKLTLRSLVSNFNLQKAPSHYHKHHHHTKDQKVTLRSLVTEYSSPNYIADNQKSCVYEGQIRSHGEAWSPGPCIPKCRCFNGLVKCNQIECPDLNCANSIRKKWKCCPECPPLSNNGGSCGVKTENGNANRSCCKFPFKFQDVMYYTCTYLHHNRPWCGVTKDFDTDGVWGECIDDGRPENDTTAGNTSKSTQDNGTQTKGRTLWNGEPIAIPDTAAQDSSITVYSTRPLDNVSSLNTTPPNATTTKKAKDELYPNHALEASANLVISQEVAKVLGSLMIPSHTETYPGMLAAGTPKPALPYSQQLATPAVSGAGVVPLSSAVVPVPSPVPPAITASSKPNVAPAPAGPKPQTPVTPGARIVPPVNTAPSPPVNTAFPNNAASPTRTQQVNVPNTTPTANTFPSPQLVAPSPARLTSQPAATPVPIANPSASPQPSAPASFTPAASPYTSPTLANSPTGPPTNSALMTNPLASVPVASASPLADQNPMGCSANDCPPFETVTVALKNAGFSTPADPLTEWAGKCNKLKGETKPAAGGDAISGNGLSNKAQSPLVPGQKNDPKLTLHIPAGGPSPNSIPEEPQMSKVAKIKTLERQKLPAPVEAAISAQKQFRKKLEAKKAQALSPIPVNPSEMQSDQSGTSRQETICFPMPEWSSGVPIPCGNGTSSSSSQSGGCTHLPGCGNGTQSGGSGSSTPPPNPCGTSTGCVYPTNAPTTTPWVWANMTAPPVTTVPPAVTNATVPPAVTNATAVPGVNITTTPAPNVTNATMPTALPNTSVATTTPPAGNMTIPILEGYKDPGTQINNTEMGLLPQYAPLKGPTGYGPNSSYGTEGEAEKKVSPVSQYSNSLGNAQQVYSSTGSEYGSTYYASTSENRVPATQYTVPAAAPAPAPAPALPASPAAYSSPSTSSSSTDTSQYSTQLPDPVQLQYNDATGSKTPQTSARETEAQSTSYSSASGINSLSVDSNDLYAAQREASDQVFKQAEDYNKYIKDYYAAYSDERHNDTVLNDEMHPEGHTEENGKEEGSNHQESGGGSTAASNQGSNSTIKQLGSVLGSIMTKVLAAVVPTPTPTPGANQQASTPAVKPARPVSSSTHSEPAQAIKPTATVKPKTIQPSSSNQYLVPPQSVRSDYTNVKPTMAVDQLQSSPVPLPQYSYKVPQPVEISHYPVQSSAVPLNQQAAPPSKGTELGVATPPGGIQEKVHILPLGPEMSVVPPPYVIAGAGPPPSITQEAPSAVQLPSPNKQGASAPLSVQLPKPKAWPVEESSPAASNYPPGTDNQPFHISQVTRHNGEVIATMESVPLPYNNFTTTALPFTTTPTPNTNATIATTPVTTTPTPFVWPNITAPCGNVNSPNSAAGGCTYPTTAPPVPCTTEGQTGGCTYPPTSMPCQTGGCVTTPSTTPWVWPNMTAPTTAPTTGSETTTPTPVVWPNITAPSNTPTPYVWPNITAPPTNNTEAPLAGSYQDQPGKENKGLLPQNAILKGPTGYNSTEKSNDKTASNYTSRNQSSGSQQYQHTDNANASDASATSYQNKAASANDSTASSTLNYPAAAQAPAPEASYYAAPPPSPYPSPYLSPYPYPYPSPYSSPYPSPYQAQHQDPYQATYNDAASRSSKLGSRYENDPYEAQRYAAAIARKSAEDYNQYLEEYYSSYKGK